MSKGEIHIGRAKPPIKLLERTRWKDRDTFARLIKANLDKIRVRQLVISAEHVPGLIDKIADHLDDTMEPGAEFLLDAYQPPREAKKASANHQLRSLEEEPSCGNNLLPARNKLASKYAFTQKGRLSHSFSSRSTQTMNSKTSSGRASSGANEIVCSR